MNWNPSPLRQRQPRERNGAYMAWIARSPCVACMALGRGFVTPVEVAHIRFGDPDRGWQPTGAAQKPDDRRTAPLCVAHHRIGPEAQHGRGERQWWAWLGVDPINLVADLNAAYDAGGMPAGVVARHAGLAQRRRRTAE